MKKKKNKVQTQNLMGFLYYVQDSHNEVQQELSCTADYGNTEDEWHKLQQNCQPPLSKRETLGPCVDHASCRDFHISIGNLRFDMVHTPVLSEKYIGIDQGVRNLLRYCGRAEKTIQRDCHGTRPRHRREISNYCCG